MAFPEGIDLVTVTGTIAGLPEGVTPEAVFECKYWLVGPTDDAVVPPFTLSAEFDSEGSFELDLPATDDPDWLPDEWGYLVTLRFGNKMVRGMVEVPLGGGPVDLADIFNPGAQPYESVNYMPLALRGVPGGVASLDNAGLVPLSQLPDAELPPITINDVDDLQTQLDGKQPAGTYLVPDDIDNLVSSETLTEGLGTKLPKVAPVVMDSTFTVARTAGGAARWRTSGAALDIDVVGDVIESRFANQDFTGAQTSLRRMRGSGNTLVGRTEFGTGPYASENYIDPTTGEAFLGGKAGAGLSITGYKATAGAPTTGTWTVGQQVMDSNGVFWRCSVAGTPGTWVSGLTDALALKADLVGGKVPQSQIPAIAITTFLGTSANQAAMLAKVGEPGDWTNRTDLGTAWQMTGSDPTQLANWTQLLTPTSPVQSVAGKTGAVTLVAGDVGLGNVTNTADSAKPVSSAQQAALDLKANLVSPTFTGTPAVPTPSINSFTTTIPSTAMVQTLVNTRLNFLTTGEEAILRELAQSETNPDTGTIFLTYFTARKTETITKMFSGTGGTAGTLTLAKIGVYSAAAGTLTRVAQTNNLAGSLWNGAFTTYQPALAASWNKVAGTRYAVAFLCIGSVMPQLEFQSVRYHSVGQDPRIQGEFPGQTDLPTTITEGSLGNGYRRFQAIMLP